MSTRFKSRCIPVLAALALAGSSAAVHAAVVTAAGFTFESYTQTTTANLATLSVPADVFDTGYGGTLLISKPADGALGFGQGNGAGTGIRATDALGLTALISFPIDNISSLQLGVDLNVTGSNGPGSYAVSYSTDGVNFTPAATINLDTAYGWMSRVRIPGSIFTISLPATFQDPNPSAPGDMAYILISQTGTNGPSAYNTTATSAGTLQLDNVYVTGTAIPEPASLALTGTAGLALLTRRR